MTGLAESNGIRPVRPNWRVRSELWAQWIAVFMPIAVVLPTAWLSVSQVLLLVFWLLGGHHAYRFGLIKRNPVAVLALALFALLSVGTLYSIAGWTVALDTLDNYLALLMVPVVVSLFDSPAWQRRGVTALAIGVFIVMTVAYLRWIGVLPAATELRMAFKSHITEGLFLALGFFLFLHLGVDRARARGLWLLAAAMVLPLLFFFYGGKTGYVVVLGLVLLFAWQRLGFRALLPAVVGLALLLALVWSTSAVFQQRVADGLQGMGPLEKGASSGEHSVALRLEFYRNTWNLIEQRPLFGVGTGGFPEAYRDSVAETGTASGLVTDNPHNEYLLLAAELGLAGPLVFVSLLGVHRHAALQ